MYECAICGEPLELPELLNLDICQIGADHICAICIEERVEDEMIEAMEEYIW
jgi:hypothetical protein